MAFLGRQEPAGPDLVRLQDFAAEVLAVNPNDSSVENAAVPGRNRLCTATEPLVVVTF
jgi:hypothetical protein